MSFMFTLSAPQRPDYEGILSGLKLKDVERVDHGEEHEIIDGFWPEGLKHFHRPGRSTRGVEVEWDDGEFIVEIPSLGSPEDYDLGLRFIESAAEVYGTEITPEDGDPLPVADLRTRFDAAWADRMNESAIASIRALLAEEDQIMTMLGTNRPFHIGSALLEELDESGPPEQFQQRLIDVMRQVQNVDAEAFTFAETLEIGKSEGPEDTVTMAMWEPDKSYLFPDVDFLMLVDGVEKPFFIPYETLPEILEEGWVFIDERQMLVDAVPKEEWPALVQRAAPFAEVPLPE